MATRARDVQLRSDKERQDSELNRSQPKMYNSQVTV